MIGGWKNNIYIYIYIYVYKLFYIIDIFYLIKNATFDLKRWALEGGASIYICGIGVKSVPHGAAASATC